MSAQLVVDIQIASVVASVPEQATIETLLRQVIGTVIDDGNHELAMRIVDEQEGRELNRRFRQIDHATNVLSFPADANGFARLSRQPLGDIVICGPVVEREASEQGKDIANHWTHMIVHGALHLLGYDHQTDEEAAIMESLEKNILALRGINDPYAAIRE